MTTTSITYPTNISQTKHAAGEWHNHLCDTPTCIFCMRASRDSIHQFFREMCLSACFHFHLCDSTPAIGDMIIDVDFYNMGELSVTHIFIFIYRVPYRTIQDLLWGSTCHSRFYSKTPQKSSEKNLSQRRHPWRLRVRSCPTMELVLVLSMFIARPRM